jgi:hypothetical protein
MTWTRLGDDFTDQPSVLRLSRSARMLHVEALVWCNRLLTDGALPVAALPRITDTEDLDGEVAELAGEGLWTRVDNRTWQVDWSDQEPAKKVEQRREDRNARQRAYDRRKRARPDARDDASGDGQDDAPDDAPDDASGDGQDDPSPDALPTRPDPTPGEGRGEGGGDSTSSDDSASLVASSAAPPWEEPAWTAGPGPGMKVYVNGEEVSR